MSSKALIAIPMLLAMANLPAQGMAVESSSAADALIIVSSMQNAPQKTPAAISQQVNARIAFTASVSRLKPEYSSVDVVEIPAGASSVTEDSILSVIKKRKNAEHVDVLVLSTPLAPATARTRALVRSAQVSNLRMVYLGGQVRSGAVQDFRRMGAKITLAQSDFTASSMFSSTRFIRRWSEGWQASAAAEDASTYAAGVQEALGVYARASGTPGLSISGTDVDRNGGTYATVSKHELSAKLPAAVAEGLIPAPPVSKTPFQAAAVAASSALVPSVDVNTDAVPNAGALLDKVQPLAWEQLESVFTSNSSQPSTTETDPQAQEIWVDGAFLKFMAAPLASWAGGKYASVMQYLQGVKLTRQSDHLEIALYFSQAFDISIRDPSQASNFQLYAVHVPKTVRVAISSSSRAVELAGLDDPEGMEQDHLFLELKIPVVSNKIYLRNASIDLLSGKVEAEAGVLGDTVGLAAMAQIFVSQIKPKFDFWQTVKDNESLFEWPYLEFEREL